MAQRMLIDATHPEETRVAVVSGNRLEDLDYETSTKKQLKGNIYLAKVVRVEPSLQACFVDYGGNRHGFLAFSEIHPDYYRIPVSDREALLAEQAAAARAEEEAEEREADAVDVPAGDDTPAAGEPEVVSAPVEVTEVGGFEPAALDETSETRERAAAEPAQEPAAPAPEPAPSWTPTEWAIATAAPPAEATGEEPGPGAAALRLPVAQTEGKPGTDNAAAGAGVPAEADAATDGEAEAAAERPADAPGTGGRIDTVGGDAGDELPRRRPRPLRNYKIQEVIKRRQIMLVQVVKEERGNKGAALTTYLSLAGRYCVLMPNTTRGGGVSRKITSAQDRRRLKTLLDDLELPEGMAVIVRTAGSERSKAEVKRDCDYLLRLWDEIREMTLKSTAPCLIYEEASLIKRAIRDLYARDIDEVLVEGEEGYRAAKDFMKMLMPSHAKKVQLYRDEIPLFHRFQIESQIDAMHSPVVQLRSGGYIVINPTEALVAIDVNSGRATRERFIEETALRTNLEAAEEVARQLRLRDLGGLIVIDFIDMEDHRNNQAVERRLKDALRFDRARIQVGRISPFGLLELSRQRLRPSITETSTMPCPHCNGTGHIRSTESAALHVLRAIEEEGIRRRSREIVVHVATAVALYVLNQKRARLTEIEQRYGLSVMIAADPALVPPDYRLERVRSASAAEGAAPIRAESVLPTMGEAPGEELEELESDGEAEAEEAEGEAPARAEPGGERVHAGNGDGEGEGGRRRRRRRGRHRRRDGEEREGAPRPEAAPAAPERAPYPADGTGEQPAVEGPFGVEEPPEPGDDGERPERAERPAGAEGAPGEQRPRRRRGRRGGRRRGRREQVPEGAFVGGPGAEPDLAPAVEERAGASAAAAAPADDAPAWPRDPADQEPPREPALTAAERPWPLSPESHSAAPAVAPEPAPEPIAPVPVAPPAAAAPAARTPRANVPANVVVVDETTPKPAARRGWWQRLTQGGG
jgi:ribonuclease E